MPAPHTYETEAIIIRKTNLGEADRILTLYTPRLGKISAVAKGVRRPRSKLSGHLEILTYSTVNLVKGRTLETIIGSQTINSFMSIKGDLVLTSYALYAAELVNLFTPDEQENYPLFQLLLGTLEQLTQAGNKELLMRYFEIQLLSVSGYRPELRQCVYCHQPLQETANMFCHNLGGILCSECAPGKTSLFPLSVNAQKVFKLLQGHDFATVSRLRLDANLADELERVLSGYITYTLERDVKSASWLDKLRDEMRKMAVKK